MNKEKLKDIYDKIRSPDNNKTKITAESENSPSPIIEPKKDSRHRIESENEYLAKITGRSKRKIQDPKYDKPSAQ